MRNPNLSYLLLHSLHLSTESRSLSNFSKFNIKTLVIFVPYLFDVRAKVDPRVLGKGSKFLFFLKFCFFYVVFNSCFVDRKKKHNEKNEQNHV